MCVEMCTEISGDMRVDVCAGVDMVPDVDLRPDVDIDQMWIVDHDVGEMPVWVCA